MTHFEIDTNITEICVHGSWKMTFTPSSTLVTIEDTDQQKFAANVLLKLLKMVKHSDLNTDQLKDLSKQAAEDCCQLSMPKASFENFKDMVEAVTKER